MTQYQKNSPAGIEKQNFFPAWLRIMKEGENEHWNFLLITFAFSWGLWSIPVLAGLDISHPLTIACFALGGIAPSTTGIILAKTGGSREYWTDFLRRTLSFRQISLSWWGIMLLIIPLTTAIGLLAWYITTGSVPEFETLNKFIASPLSIIPFALFMFIFGPVPEEIGWRGYALDHLERKYSRVKASMILGFFWMMWHIPMFMISGTYQHGLFQESPWLMLDFMIQFYPLSIIMDWIYHNTRRSILSGVMLHFFINFFGEFIDIPGEAKFYRTGVQTILALTIIAVWYLEKRKADRK